MNNSVVKVLVGDNCKACDILKNRINKLIIDKKVASDDVQILDVEREGKALAIKYRVMSIPAMLSQKEMLSGAVSSDKILTFIKNGRI